MSGIRKDEEHCVEERYTTAHKCDLLAVAEQAYESALNDVWVNLLEETSLKELMLEIRDVHMYKSSEFIVESLIKRRERGCT